MSIEKHNVSRLNYHRFSMNCHYSVLLPVEVIGPVLLQRCYSNSCTTLQCPSSLYGHIILCIWFSYVLVGVQNSSYPSPGCVMCLHFLFYWDLQLTGSRWFHFLSCPVSIHISFNFLKNLISNVQSLSPFIF